MRILFSLHFRMTNIFRLICGNVLCHRVRNDYEAVALYWIKLTMKKFG